MVVQLAMTFEEVPAVKKLIALNLPTDCYAIAGTGIMFALGIRHLEDFTDIDLCATGEAFAILSRNADTEKYDDVWDCQCVVLYAGEIEAFSKFGPKGFDWEKAMASSVLIHGLPFWTLETVLLWKKMMNRPKDAGHIALIEAYMQSNSKV